MSRRKFVTTTVKNGGRQAPDLVARNFAAERPDLLWVADIRPVSVLPRCNMGLKSSDPMNRSLVG